jgi:hypothetical protein
MAITQPWHIAIIAATTHVIADHRNFSLQGSSQAVAAELKLF